MDPTGLVSDGLSAYTLSKDSFKIVGDVIASLNQTGISPIYPELRIKLKESKMEFNSGLELKNKIFQLDKNVKLNFPVPTKIHIYSLQPYQPLSGIFSIKNDAIYLDTKSLKQYGENFRVTMEYTIESDEAVKNLVYTSAPMDSYIDANSGDENERYWLHAELKTLKLLKTIYSAIRIEDVELMVEVAVKEHIRELFSQDIRFEMMMMAKFTSSDRNERARAISYRTRHTPKFKGNLFKVINDLQEILQPSRFRSFLNFNGQDFRYNSCQKGVTLADAMEPIYLPNYMNIISSTDLTLDEPAKSGELVYKKEQFKKRVKKTIDDAKEETKGY